MTITISPEIEKALTDIAMRQGTTPEKIANEALKEKFISTLETPEERKARIFSLMGSMAYLGPSHILEDRAEEIAREEQRQRK